MQKTLDDVVSAYIIDKESLFAKARVLLIYHKRYGKWLPVGGGEKRNETPDDAIHREVMEEIGIKVELLEYPAPRPGNEKQFALPFYINYHPQVEKGFFQYALNFLCVPKTKDVTPRKREVLEYGWFTKNDLAKLNPPLGEGVKLTCIEAIDRASKIILKRKLKEFFKYNPKR